MINEIDNLLSAVKTQRFTNPNDLNLIQAEASLLLAQEIQKLRLDIEKVIAASDNIPGGYAIRTTSVK